MADIDTSLMEQIFNVSQRKWEANVHHHRKADDLRRCFEIAKGIGHPQRLRNLSLPFIPSAQRFCGFNESP